MNVSFSLPLNANAAQVREVVQAIHEFFNLTADTPQSVIEHAAASAAVAHGTVSAASLATPAPAQASNTGVELDTAGLPWHADIHASSKTKNDDGTWRKKRGVDKATVTRVEAELRQVQAAPAPVNSTPPPSAAIPSPSAAVVPPAMTAAQPASPPPGIPVPGANIANPYTDLVAYLAKHTNTPENPTGRIPSNYPDQLLVHYGVTDGSGNPSLTLLAGRPDIAKTMHDFLKSQIGE